MVDLGLGILIGIVITAIVAHNKPEWFAKVVKKAADVENKVQDAVKDKLK